MEEFITSLQAYHSDTAFNPWADYDPVCDLSPEAPLIRAANLKRYLSLRKNARFLFIAEGLGYQGGHFSGMAMTSERILLGFHPTVPPEVVLGEDWDYRRTSNPASPLLNRMQKEKGFNEPTATVMWGELAKQGLAPFQTILWNIFPFHPYKPSGLLTNRTPTPAELDTGILFARKLMELVPGMRVIAIGRKSAETLEKYGVPCEAVPHPSMGGAARFRAAVDLLFAKKS
jgi:hypothetical protein